MSTQAAGFSRAGFVKTYVIPAAWVFAIPVFALWFFQHVQAAPDSFADFTVRWMLRLSLVSIVSSLVVFAIAALGVLCSLRSQRVQYFSLAGGWHLLRVFALGQVLFQGCAATALSYWVPSLWFGGYSERLVAGVGLTALVAGGALVKAIFLTPDDRFELDGVIIKRTAGSLIWQDLDRICAQVGTRTPHRIVAGIDDAFFVTEHPVTIKGAAHEGRTLYVSLPLLKTLNGTQADAVMAHEMAHFSGEDTLYSKKIAPLLARYAASLKALHDGLISMPVFYFMRCFRSLFEISLKRLSRQREFRADRIASTVASPEDIVHALLTTSAYSQYRSTIEGELFAARQTPDALKIPQRVEDGFRPFARAFVEDGRALGAATSHPFDSHPSFKERAENVSMRLSVKQLAEIVSADVDGRWYHNIENAETLERGLWTAYEEQFRTAHEEALAWRYVPETDAERAIVLAHFPEVSLEGRFGRSVVFTYEGVWYSKWVSRVRFSDITKVTRRDGTFPALRLLVDGARAHTVKLPLYLFSSHTEAVVETFAKYYRRHLAMKQYVSETRERSARIA